MTKHQQHEYFESSRLDEMRRQAHPEYDRTQAKSSKELLHEFNKRVAQRRKKQERRNTLIDLITVLSFVMILIMTIRSLFI